MQRSPDIPYKVAITLHIVSVVLFLASLTQPAYAALTTNGESVAYGIFALALGIVGHKAWFANPLLLFAWISFFKGHGYLSALLAAIALGVSLTFLQADQTVAVGSMGAYPYHPRIGYYIWLSSLVAAIGSGLGPVNTSASHQR